MPLKKHKFQLNEKEFALYEYADTAEANLHDAEILSDINEYYFRTKKPLKKGRSADALFQKIMEGKDELIQLDKHSTRSVILAFVKVLQKTDGQFPKTNFLIGCNTLIKCKTAVEESRRTQHGNIEMEAFPIKIVGGKFSYSKDSEGEPQRVKTMYGEIQETIGKATNNDKKREQALANAMRGKSRDISAFTHRDFNKDGRVRLGSEGYDNVWCRQKPWFIYRLAFFTSLNFLRTVVEISRRLYRNPEDGSVFDYKNWPDQAKASDRIPVGIAQQRTSKLLSRGVIRMFDAYGYSKTEKKHRSAYGVVTGEETIRNIETTKNKLSRVNMTYTLGTVELLKKQGLLSDLPEKINLNELRVGGGLLRKELSEEFGGDSESSGGDYSDFFEVASDAERKDKVPDVVGEQPSVMLDSAASVPSADSTDTPLEALGKGILAKPIGGLFSYAASLIRSNKNLTLQQLLESDRAQELINHIDTQSTTDCYDIHEGVVDVFCEKTTKRAVLHVAIEAENVSAFELLIKAGAPKDIPYVLIEYKERSVQGDVTQENDKWIVTYGDFQEILSQKPIVRGSEVVLYKYSHEKTFSLEEHMQYCGANTEFMEKITELTADVTRLAV